MGSTLGSQEGRRSISIWAGRSWGLRRWAGGAGRGPSDPVWCRCSAPEATALGGVEGQTWAKKTMALVCTPNIQCLSAREDTGGQTLSSSRRSLGDTETVAHGSHGGLPEGGST